MIYISPFSKSCHRSFNRTLINAYVQIPRVLNALIDVASHMGELAVVVTLMKLSQLIFQVRTYLAYSYVFKKSMSSLLA